MYVGFGCVNSKISYLKWHYELRVLSEHRVVQEVQQRGILGTAFLFPENLFADAKAFLIVKYIALIEPTINC